MCLNLFRTSLFFLSNAQKKSAVSNRQQSYSCFYLFLKITYRVIVTYFIFLSLIFKSLIMYQIKIIYNHYLGSVSCHCHHTGRNGYIVHRHAVYLLKKGLCTQVSISVVGRIVYKTYTMVHR